MAVPDIPPFTGPGGFSSLNNSLFTFNKPPTSVGNFHQRAIAGPKHLNRSRAGKYTERNSRSSQLDESNTRLELIHQAHTNDPKPLRAHRASSPYSVSGESERSRAPLSQAHKGFFPSPTRWPDPDACVEHPYVTDNTKEPRLFSDILSRGKDSGPSQVWEQPITHVKTPREQLTNQTRPRDPRPSRAVKSLTRAGASCPNPGDQYSTADDSNRAPRQPNVKNGIEVPRVSSPRPHHNDLQPKTAGSRRSSEGKKAQREAYPSQSHGRDSQTRKTEFARNSNMTDGQSTTTSNRHSGTEDMRVARNTEVSPSDSHANSYLTVGGYYSSSRPPENGGDTEVS
ncbi:hypothetical protein B0J17DRAFT_723182 [Rhizoctonia solani]|nr:hypothetical protein B0J17DRAFT_723182 [Rhizoctonia solani]